MKQWPKNNKLKGRRTTNIKPEKIEDKLQEHLHIREDQDYIKIEDCIHGGLYLIRARNFDYGVYNEENKSYNRCSLIKSH